MTPTCFKKHTHLVSSAFCNKVSKCPDSDIRAIVLDAYIEGFTQSPYVAIYTVLEHSVRYGTRCVPYILVPIDIYHSHSNQINDNVLTKAFEHSVQSHTYTTIVELFRQRAVNRMHTELKQSHVPQEWVMPLQNAVDTLEKRKFYNSPKNQMGIIPNR